MFLWERLSSHDRSNIEIPILLRNIKEVTGGVNPIGLKDELRTSNNDVTSLRTLIKYVIVN
jgi:hypothetical protein